MQAFRSSDLTGEARPSDWVPGAEAIPTDFTKKVMELYSFNTIVHTCRWPTTSRGMARGTSRKSS